MPTLMVAHLQFHTSQHTIQNCKRATKPTHQDRHEMTANKHDRKEGRRHNTGLAKVAVQCYADTFVVNQSLVLRINICGEIPAHRKSANR